MQCCHLCKDQYKQQEAYFLADNLPICSVCGTYVKNLCRPNTPAERRCARDYLMKQFEAATNPEVCTAIIELLEENPVEAEESAHDQTYADRAHSTNLMETLDKLKDESTYSRASNKDLPYVVIQVTLKEKLWGTGSGNLFELENIINQYAYKGYRLHTMATSTSHSTGLAGGDRIQATLVFERK